MEMNQLPPLPPPDPIQQLILFYAKELFEEVLYNDDKTLFWKSAGEDVFEMALPSFREGLQTLQGRFAENKDMYNYFSSLCFRTFSQPFTRQALTLFTKGFDEIAAEGIFGDGFNFRASQLSNVEQLMLFAAVHRDQLAMAERRHMELAVAEQEARRIAQRQRNSSLSTLRGGT